MLFLLASRKLSLHISTPSSNIFFLNFSYFFCPNKWDFWPAVWVKVWAFYKRKLEKVSSSVFVLISTNEASRKYFLWTNKTAQDTTMSWNGFGRCYYSFLRVMTGENGEMRFPMRFFKLSEALHLAEEPNGPEFWTKLAKFGLITRLKNIKMYQFSAFQQFLQGLLHLSIFIRNRVGIL